MTIAHRFRQLAVLLVPALVLAGAAVAPRPAHATDDAVELTLVATNDFHRQLAPVDNPGGWDHGLGGAAWLAAHLGGVRERAPGALHLDSGDLTGAGRAGLKGDTGLGAPGGYADEAVVDVMNAMGLEATTVGNHEFDSGLQEARRIRQGGCWDDDCSYRHNHEHVGAEFATLGANVLDAATGDPVFAPWTILQANGVDVGIVGITETSLVNPDGLRLLNPYQAVNPAVEEVVQAGADVVVVLWHDGSKQNPEGAYDANGCENLTGPSAKMLPYFHEAVDVVVDGHTHHAYVCDLEGLPLLTQASSRGLMYTEITLAYDPANEEVVERTATNRQVTHDIGPDPEVTTVLERYRAGLDEDASTTADLDGDTLGDAYEAIASRTNPLAFDTDDDGIDDGTEIAAGTDPLDPLHHPCSTRPFTDVPADHVFCPQISWMADQQISTGHPDGTYRPTTDVTRGAMAAFMARLADADPPDCTTRPFTDVPADHVFCPQISWMADQQISTGHPDGTYRPTTDVTRGAMAAFMARLADADPPDCTTRPFTDVPADHVFCPQISWMADQQISTGHPDGTYRPTTDVTRGAMAAFMARLADSTS